MSKDAYIEYLTTKVKVADKKGIKVSQDDLHPSGKPHQKAIIQWGLELGAGLIASDAGTGKTHMGIDTLRMLHANFGGKYLIVTELGASETFVNPDVVIGEGARMGIPLDYVTSTKQAFQSNCDIVVTNYERVRNGEFNFGAFGGVWLDEGNYVKNMASDTTDILIKELAKVKYKWIATATPSPNETLELINYAHALGICDRGQILTRFFQRNSVVAGDLTLHPQHKADFWLWVYSWAIFITEPSDLGFENGDYTLPELIVNWHEVPMDFAIEGGIERNGQKKLFANSTNSLPEAAKVKRASIDARVSYALNIIADNPDDHYIIWHHLEDERKALAAAFKGNKGYKEIFGKQDWSVRQQHVVDFSKGDIQILGTKPDLNGVGCNFQYHCHRAIALGLNHSWDEFYQAIIKRIYRFGQKFPVVIDALYVREEYEIVNNIKEKWRLHDEMRAEMRAIVKEFGLDHSLQIEQRKRSFVQERVEYKGENYTLVKNDTVYEWYDLPSDSIDLINTSFPFGNHYEYTDKYNDFGHNSTNSDFFRQMDFLIPEMFRTMKPGRIVAVHLKNRIHYGSVTGLGFSIFHRFTHAVCDAMEKHGFHSMGFHYVPTCVVGENNQTYRLTFGEMQKDSTKMGAGIPEEIWIFRKPPTSTDNAYADEPVMHNMCGCPYCGHKDVVEEFVRPNAILMDCKKCGQYFQPEELVQASQQDYTLAKWQIDADAFWQSSGDRLITPEEMKRSTIRDIRKWWNVFNRDTVYDYDSHVRLLQELDAAGKLSRTWTTLPLRSNTGYIWNDVNRMHGLNQQQRLRKQQNHICPQPYDEVNRIIELYSNEGDLVADNFGGIGTTGVCALKKKRRVFLTELNDTYAKCAAMYLKETEIKNEVPTLFELVQDDGTADE